MTIIRPGNCINRERGRQTCRTQTARFSTNAPNYGICLMARPEQVVIENNALTATAGLMVWGQKLQLPERADQVQFCLEHQRRDRTGDAT